MTAVTVATIQATLKDSWELTLRSERLAPNTIKGYLQALDMYLAYCTRSHRQPMERTTMKRWMVTLMDEGRQPATVRARLAGIQNFARWCVDDEDVDLDHSPFAGLKRPKLDQSIVTPLTLAQLVAMVKACQAPKGAPYDIRMRARRDEALIRFMAETMARSNEVLSMDLASVDLKTRRATLRGKASAARGTGARERVVVFSPECAQALDRYLRLRAEHRRGHTTRFWLGADGKAFGYSGLDNTLKARAQQAGVEGFHNHRLRHTAATRFLDKGGSQSALMALAGWTRSDMAERYTRHTATERAIAEAERMDLGNWSA